MVRSILAFTAALALSVPAFAQEMDPAKTNCGDVYAKMAESMVKHGETLQKSGKVAQITAKALRKHSPIESRIQALSAAGMMKAGRDMVRNAKRLKSMAERLRKSGKDHSIADHMAAAGKMPEKIRAKIAELGKVSATEMKEWGNEMAKNAEMMLGMYEKLAAGGGEAKAPEKKEEEKKEEKKEEEKKE